LKIDFLEAVVDDGSGGERKAYLAVYGPQSKTLMVMSGKILRDLDRDVAKILSVRSSLDVEGLDDVEVAEVLAEAILRRMDQEVLPHHLSAEALLFTVVNEAVHELEKTLSDFLLTE
jgi:hypothetical protein